MKNRVQAVVVKSVEEWALQVYEATEQIKVMNGGKAPATVQEGHAIDPEAFCRQIEGLYALAENGVEGVPMPDAELQRLAGLRPVSEVLGLP